MLIKVVDEEMLTTTTANTSAKSSSSDKSASYSSIQPHHDEYGHYRHSGGDYDDAAFSPDNDNDDSSTSSGSMIVYEVDEQEMNTPKQENHPYRYEQEPLSSSPPLACREDDSMHKQSRINSAIKNKGHFSSNTQFSLARYDDNDISDLSQSISSRNSKKIKSFSDSKFQNSEPRRQNKGETMEQTKTNAAHEIPYTVVGTNERKLSIIDRTEQLQQRLMAMALAENASQTSASKNSRHDGSVTQLNHQHDSASYHDDYDHRDAASYHDDDHSKDLSMSSPSRRQKQTASIQTKRCSSNTEDDDDYANENKEHPASLNVAPTTAIFRRVRHHKHHQKRLHHKHHQKRRSSGTSNQSMSSGNSYKSNGSSSHNSHKSGGSHSSGGSSKSSNSSYHRSTAAAASSPSTVTSDYTNVAIQAYPQHHLSRTSSFLSSDAVHFDSDQKLPVDSNLIDPSKMFDNLLEDTPAAEALKANAKINPKKINNHSRPKLKNLTRDVKKESRKQKSHIKGKVIDGQHEQYALSIGMMLGIRVAVWGRHENQTMLEIQEKQKEIHDKVLEDCSYHQREESGGGNTKIMGTTPSSSTITSNGNNAVDGGVAGSLTTRASTSSPLCLDDCMKSEDYVFPPEGNNVPPHITPPHKLGHTFKFKAYAPDMFSYIRSMLGVDKEHFLLSLSGEYNFIEFISNAKSGQFFFYSHDGRYVIKTQTAAESKFLRRILPHYVQYMAKNPYNFLTHFYGMYRVKMKHLRRNMHFVVMRSVFNTEKEIHKIWDLKGSKQGRLAKPGETVFKDLDIENEGRKLTVGPEKKRLIMEQLTKDAAFLAKLKIMDYSLLLGVHDREEARGLFQSRSNLRLQSGDAVSGGRLVKVSSSSDDVGIKRSKTPLRTRNNNNEQIAAENERNDGMSDISSCSSKGETSGKRSMKSNRSSLGDEGGPHNDEDMHKDGDIDYGYDSSDSEAAHSVTVEVLVDCAASRAAAFDDDYDGDEDEINSESGEVNPMTDRKDLGIQSLTLDAETMLSKEIYFFGIIDILQQYNTKKMAETMVKRSRAKHSEISCVDPDMYAKRFVQFCSTIIE